MPQITEEDLTAYQKLWKEDGRDIDLETAREEAEYLLRLFVAIYHARRKKPAPHLNHN